MRHVFLSLIAIGSIIVTSGIAAAEGPGDLAKRIVELNHLERSMQQGAEAFLQGYKDVVGGSLQQKDPDLTDEQLAELYRIMDDEVTSGVDELMGPVKAMLVDFYVENFSEDELSTLVQMHGSDVYQKQISLTPGFMQEVAKLQAEWQMSAQSRLSGRVKEWLENYADSKAE